MTQKEMYERVRKDVHRQYKEEINELRAKNIYLSNKVLELETENRRLRGQVERAPSPPRDLMTMLNMCRALLGSEEEFYTRGENTDDS